MSMKDFFNQLWVKVLSYIFIVLGTLTLILGGTAVGDIIQIPELVLGIVEAVGILMLFIRKLLNKKAADGK